MGRNFTLVACSTFLCCLLFSCNKEKYTVEKPVYFSMPGFELRDADHGTNHSRITTAWISIDKDPIGAFELPATVPVLMEDGRNDIKIYPGINLNGISSSRAIYEFFAPLDTTIQKPNGGDTIFFPVIKTRYTDRATVDIVEDFDGAGLELEPTVKSDTGIRKVNDSSLVFRYPGENNGNAGALYTTSSSRHAEVATTDYYELPQGGANVYLELSYRCNIPFIVGVIADLPTGQRQQQTVVVNPHEEDWNKIYINLVTEVSSLTGSNRFKIFFGTVHQSNVETGKIFLDNIKLVY